MHREQIETWSRNKKQAFQNTQTKTRKRNTFKYCVRSFFCYKLTSSLSKATKWNSIKFSFETCLFYHLLLFATPDSDLRARLVWGRWKKGDFEKSFCLPNVFVSVGWIRGVKLLFKRMYTQSRNALSKWQLSFQYKGLGEEGVRSTPDRTNHIKRHSQGNWISFSALRRGYERVHFLRAERVGLERASKYLKMSKIVL